MPESVTFFSDRLRLQGDLYRPDGDARADAPRPGILSLSGYEGLKDIHPARFARQLTPEGYVCLAFDYRGFGSSEGERGRVAPQEQVEDTYNAVTYLADRPEVDPERIAVIGWGMGGGIGVQLAAQDRRVKALAVCNGIGSGSRTTRASHDEASWARLLELLAADRSRRVYAGFSELVDPFTVLRLPGRTQQYVDSDLKPVPGFGTGGVSLESAELMLRFEPELMAHLIAPRPVLIVHGTENMLYGPAEASGLARAIGSSAELTWLDGAGHTEFMHDDDPVFGRLTNSLIRFFAEHL